MASGFFLGGAAEGMNNAIEQQRQASLLDLQRQQLGLGQQRLGLDTQVAGQNYELGKQRVGLQEKGLGLQQQQVQFNQQRALIADADQNVANTMKIVGDTITQAKEQGKDPDQILKVVSPLVQNAQTIYAKLNKVFPGSGRDPANLTNQVQALLQQPTGEEAATQRGKLKATEAAPTAGKIQVVKDAFGNEKPVFANPITGQVTPFPQQADNGSANPVKDIANAIIEGKQPPDLKGMYRQGGAVRAELAAQGFDLSKAEQEWQSAHKQIISLNGPQMVRYAGLATSVVNTIDEARNLAKELNNSGIPLLNKAKLTTYIQTQGNSEKGQLAAKYLATINTLQEEFANLAQGGYAPTESAWHLARQQINGDYGVKQLDASLSEVQRLIRYRLQGIPNFQTLGPSAPNRYFNSGQPAHGESAAPSIPAPPAGFVISK